MSALDQARDCHKALKNDKEVEEFTKKIKEYKEKLEASNV
jgi:hypothetical protein